MSPVKSEPPSQRAKNAVTGSSKTDMIAIGITGNIQQTATKYARLKSIETVKLASSESLDLFVPTVKPPCPIWSIFLDLIEPRV